MPSDPTTVADAEVVGTVETAGVVVVEAVVATKMVRAVAATKPSQVSQTRTKLAPNAEEPDIQTSRLESGPDVITIIDTEKVLSSVQSQLPAPGRIFIL